MYVSVSCVVLGQVVIFASRNLLMYALFVMPLFHLFVLLYEEPTLREKFGEEYDAYCRRVPRWLPKLKADR